MPDTDPQPTTRLASRKPPDLSPYHVRNDALGDMTGPEVTALARVDVTDVDCLNRLSVPAVEALVALHEHRLRRLWRGDRTSPVWDWVGRRVAAGIDTGSAADDVRREVEFLRATLYRRRCEADRDERIARASGPPRRTAPSLPADAPADMEDCPAARSKAAPPAAGNAVARADPSNRLFSPAGRGRVTAVPEWVRAFVPAVLSRRKEDGLAARGACVGNLILALAQLSYWSEPGADGRPRAACDRRRRVDGVWWLRLSPAALGRQTGLGTRAARAAVDRLVEYGVLEVRAGGGGYGPNTKWVRVRWEDVEPAVEKLRAAGKTRRDGST